MRIAKTIWLFIGIVLCTLVGSGRSWGGETTVYATSGYFTWNEKIDGADFIKESGMMTAMGVARSDTISDMVVLEELIEVWGGNIEYDGHDLTNSRTLKTDTTYLGTREEISAGTRWAITRNLAVGPLTGAGHKFWIRTRSNEQWNTVYGKIGAAAHYSAGTRRMLVKAGVSYPMYTRSHVSLESAGYEDVVTKPRGEAALFAEAAVRQGAWSIGVRYEEMRFGESSRVSTRSTAQPSSGVAVIDSYAFQPKSTSTLVGVKVEYHF